MSDRKGETEEVREKYGNSRKWRGGGRAMGDQRGVVKDRREKTVRKGKKREDEGGEVREENREVYERHRDHMVPPGLLDPSRLSHLTQETLTFAHKQA